MNGLSYFEIQSSKPSREIEFYSSIFGWKFIREELVPGEYYRIVAEGMNGGLLKRPTGVPPSGYGTNAFVCSVEVDNFDRVAEQILHHGGVVALPKFYIPGRCYQGYFTDPDNNTFGVFEVSVAQR